MSDQEKNHQSQQPQPPKSKPIPPQHSRPTTNEKGLPPVDQTPNMPSVKPPKK
ncbi:MAG: hypothetical protein PHQ35_10740 [Phycisphaerae bacterium]|nr:hypothetical protein [Phycisphaerae bacterium]